MRKKILALLPPARPQPGIKPGPFSPQADATHCATRARPHAPLTKPLADVRGTATYCTSNADTSSPPGPAEEKGLAPGSWGGRHCSLRLRPRAEAQGAQGGGAAGGSRAPGPEGAGRGVAGRVLIGSAGRPAAVRPRPLERGENPATAGLRCSGAGAGGRRRWQVSAAAGHAGVGSPRCDCCVWRPEAATQTREESRAWSRPGVSPLPGRPGAGAACLAPAGGGPPSGSRGAQHCAGERG